ncbi:hypothetical protein L7F22_016444 [Adiantum nelumboides]|nr:hypothetical protein [Adiantum nelumboides]
MAFLPFKRRFLLASSVLLLFTPPMFSTLVFFGPLIVSTVLAVLAVVSFRQPGGSSAGQEEEPSESCVARQNLVISSAASTEKISDGLMVGNQEVTWLEWLHNEDMEKCLAQDHIYCLPARWNFDDSDAAIESSAAPLASSLEEKRIVAESFAKECVEKVADLTGFPSNTIAREGISLTTQVDEKIILARQAAPLLAAKRVDSFMMETQAPLRDGKGWHTCEGDTKERDSTEDDGGLIQKRDAEERHCSENTNSPIWNSSDDDENKSGLRFSFFDNSCLSANFCKDVAKEVTGKGLLIPVYSRESGASSDPAWNGFSSDH